MYVNFTETTKIRNELVEELITDKSLNYQTKQNNTHEATIIDDCTNCDKLKSENALLKRYNQALKENNKLSSEMPSIEKRSKNKTSSFSNVECCSNSKALKHQLGLYQ